MLYIYIIMDNNNIRKRKINLLRKKKKRKINQIILKKQFSQLVNPFSMINNKILTLNLFEIILRKVKKLRSTLLKQQ